MGHVQLFDVKITGCSIVILLVLCGVLIDAVSDEEIAEGIYSMIQNDIQKSMMAEETANTPYRDSYSDSSEQAGAEYIQKRSAQPFDWRSSPTSQQLRGNGYMSYMMRGPTRPLTPWISFPSYADPYKIHPTHKYRAQKADNPVMAVGKSVSSAMDFLRQIMPRIGRGGNKGLYQTVRKNKWYYPEGRKYWSFKSRY